jgi:plastocyanin
MTRCAVLAILHLALSLSACERPPAAAPGDRGQSPGTAAAAAPASPLAPTPPSAPTAAGAIRGRVVYRGPLPETTRMQIPEAGDIEAHTIIVDPPTRGLKNAVVWVEGLPATPPPAAPASPTVIDQRNWVFEPHVLAIRAGSVVRILNSDIANHTVHSRTPPHEFNLGTPPGNGTERRFLRSTGSRPIELGCDVHDWMRAWIYVIENDAFARTDATGEFHINGVPAGRWRLRAHHADGGLENVIEVEVPSGGVAPVEVELRGEGRSSRSGG